MKSPKLKFGYYAKETIVFILLIPFTLLLGIICAMVGFFAPIINSIDEYIFRMRYRTDNIEEQENQYKTKDYLPWLHKRW